MDPNSPSMVDVYGRVKTIRIGKWRWPPPKGTEEGSQSFLEFKMKQQQRKFSKEQVNNPGKVGFITCSDSCSSLRKITDKYSIEDVILFIHFDIVTISK